MKAGAMKFSTREDIAAPIDFVWSAVSDFDRFEKQALRRGAEVQRVDANGAAGVASEWDLRFHFRGKMREVAAKVVDFEAPNALQLDSKTGGIDGTILVDLVALSPRQTRFAFALDLRPRNLSGRLLVQSLKFAKGSLETRFKARIAGFADRVEAEYRSQSETA